ncbi:MAG TPA: cation diffusion facilitator family transporter [Bacilli bacterium]|nr:cation diffusion facilitator family transporter [Bacilli bacterium]
MKDVQIDKDLKRAITIEKFMLKTLAWNVVLSIIKLVTGIIGSSFALISDAVNSISDIFASIVGIIGVKLSAKKADKDHPYGHERFESFFALIVAAIILFAAIELIRSSVTSLIEYFKVGTELQTPNYWALVGITVAIIIKVIIYVKTKYMAKKHNSPILKADELNHFGDIFSTMSGLVAVIGSMLGAPYLDQVGSILIAGFIIRVAVGIVLASMNQLVDESADKETVDAIIKAITRIVNKNQIDVLITRIHGVKCFVDLEIAMPGDMSLNQAHSLAEKIVTEIKFSVPVVKKTMVHVNPLSPENNK